MIRWCPQQTASQKPGAGWSQFVRSLSAAIARRAESLSQEKDWDVARVGRVVAQSPEAQARRAATKRRHDIARQGWSPLSQPAWLNADTYIGKIQPRLGTVTISAIAAALGVSEPYSSDIRAGRRRPHPRHWQALAQLVGLSPDQ